MSDTKVLRGGSWYNLPYRLRISYRDRPAFRFDDFGFRCILPVTDAGLLRELEAARSCVCTHECGEVEHTIAKLRERLDLHQTFVAAFDKAQQGTCIAPCTCMEDLKRARAALHIGGETR
jgi:hypothetical protein